MPQVGHRPQIAFWGTYSCEAPLLGVNLISINHVLYVYYGHLMLDSHIDHEILC